MKGLLCLAAIAVMGSAMAQESKGKYAQVNGLKMYYEIHGTGKPLVLLHGAFGTAEGWGPFLELSKSRQLIVIEQQGHGRTADINRPLDYRQMADDTAALLKQIGVQDADVFGYSMGGATAFALASKYPELVRKLVVIGAGTGTIKDTYNPDVYAQFKMVDPETFNFPEVKDPYTKVAPDPSKWKSLVAKVVAMDGTMKAMPEKEVRGIKAHTLIIMGDRDAVKAEHAVEIYRWIPNSQLAIFPGADHFLPFANSGQVIFALRAFLDSPMPGGK